MAGFSERCWVVVLLVQVIAAMSPDASISVSVILSVGTMQPGVSRSNQGMHGAVTKPR